ncbi:hypothetical protein [Oligoflexus sp.]|uniref:hypothetical protein n=1 Tax=Oligoflexus sp. TaxID=1971216 RepID=UPI002D77C916|nr:hypothetical protein [Oligoflexus sp.]
MRNKKLLVIIAAIILTSGGGVIAKKILDSKALEATESKQLGANGIIANNISNEDNGEISTAPVG